jgi:hypothetical protein
MPTLRNGYAVVGDGMVGRSNEIRRESCFGQGRDSDQTPREENWVTKLLASMRDNRRGGGTKELLSGTESINTNAAVRVTVVAMKPRQHNLVEPRVIGR